MRARISLFVLLLGLGASQPTLAADRYVNASATAPGDGTANSPFVLLQSGLDAAQPGDTVRVASGLYAPIKTVRDGTETGRIMVVADKTGQSIVQASGNALEATHTYHAFIGMVFDGGYGSVDAVTTDHADHIEFRRVEVRRSGGDCIDLRSVRDVLIDQSRIHHCVKVENGAVVDAHGVTGDSVFDLKINATEIFMASGDSVQLSPPREPWDNVVIENSVLWTGALDEPAGSVAAGTIVGENAVDTKVGSGQPKLSISNVVAYGFKGFISNQAAFNIKESVTVVVDRVTVYNSEIAFRLRNPATVTVQNAVVHSVDKAFRLEDALAGASLVSSTIGADVLTAFEDAGGDPTNLTLRNLLFDAAVVPAPADATASNMAFGQAAFVNEAAHDYHLVAASPAIDVGETLAAVTTDRDGIARPVGTAYDVGAFEWTNLPMDAGAGGSGAGGSGSSGAGGAAAKGGAAGTSHAGAAGAAGSAHAGAAGSASDAGGNSSEGGPAASGSSGDSGGCGCRLAPPPIGRFAGWISASVVSLLALVTRRSRRQRTLLAARLQRR